LNPAIPHDSFNERVQDARALLLKIPGVVSVSVGYKQTGRDLTDQLALRVYVQQKKKPEQIPAGESIPAEINGLPTDVIERYIPVKLSKGGTRPLVGGIKLSDYNDLQPGSSGTLGCMAKRASDGKHVVLSCQHVLHSTGTKASPENVASHIVRQPERKDCCGFYYENIVGPILAGMEDNYSYTVGGQALEFYVDCAYGLINSDVHSGNTIDKIGTIQGTEDLSSFVANNQVPPNYQVRKMGMRTGLTSGTIEEVSHEVDWPAVGGQPASTSLNCILIRPGTGGKTIKSAYTVDPADKQTILDTFAANEPLVVVTDQGNNKLSFTTNTFADHGDSGSVIVNAQNKVVGVLFGVTERSIPAIVDGSPDSVAIVTGKGFGCHIYPTMDALGFSIETGSVQVSGDPLDLDEIRLEAMEDSADVREALGRAEKRMRNIPHGSGLIELFRSHVEELIQLIHHYRPVKVVWHRHHCPAFAVSLVNTLRDSREVLVTEVKGVALGQAALAMRAALESYGSPSLKATLNEYGGLLMGLLTNCRRYPDMLRYLEEYPY
jgi:hypothetical protein